MKVRRKIPVTDKERDLMLFYFTVYEGNYNKVAKIVSQETGIPRSRKVVYETAKRNNFATLSHVVRDQVNKKFFGTDTPGMGRIMKITSDVLEIEEEMLRQAKLYINGMRSTKVDNIDQVMRVLKHVTSDLMNITGDKNIKESAFYKMSDNQKNKIGLTIDEITRDMSPEERADLLGEVAENQITTILDYKGQSIKNKKLKSKRDKEDMAELVEENFG